jgi:hypothetical protein
VEPGDVLPSDREAACALWLTRATEGRAQRRAARSVPTRSGGTSTPRARAPWRARQGGPPATSRRPRSFLMRAIPQGRGPTSCRDNSALRVRGTAVAIGSPALTINPARACDPYSGPIADPSLSPRRWSAAEPRRHRSHPSVLPAVGRAPPRDLRPQPRALAPRTPLVHGPCLDPCSASALRPGPPRPALQQSVREPGHSGPETNDDSHRSRIKRSVSPPQFALSGLAPAAS